MSDEEKTEIELEIAHVLFIDAVGYSKLSINQQRELFGQLNRVVRATPQFRTAEAAGKLIRLPTGDGMALVFSEDPQAPARCAIEIARAAKADSRLPLRMGIHSGPVSRVVDVNDQSNAAGAGINIAQRVMSCGDSGHILLSKRVSDDLAEHSYWRPHLHDLGECEVKHGIRIGLVNLYMDDVGNSRLPARLQEITLGRLRLARKNRRNILFAASIAIAISLAIFFLWKWFGGWSGREKSIAVLPFKNMGDNVENAAITDG
ncbi:MAG: Tetratricopeptide 2 repeat protein, partial [Spartobacteria bacterium]|nr:Tetratricopeptide 2 repeat protein [Spartobacteria bacterium]